jgi:hypothetical protein
MRRRLTYANVVSSLALFLAMTGGALASFNQITSIKQISPGVAAHLRGQKGPKGATGATGAKGPAGMKGGTGPASPPGLAGAQGSEGPEGASGAQGPAGPAGPAGTDGSVIATRVRSIAPLTTSSTSLSSPTYNPISVSGGSWTQGGTELDEIVGYINVTSPTTSQCPSPSGGGTPGANIQVLVDGQPELFAAPDATTARLSTTTTLPLVGDGGYPTSDPAPVTGLGFSAGGTNVDPTDWLPEPGSSASHQITVQAADDCGSSATADFTINSVSLDVIAFQ